ncbi:alpha/beta hydrolase [Ferruginibacter albus]|uniref:alpha/beta hydrolase n=1 Tax=Ferruginibacter albus TaxID=2875540 RepID=UPI001CC3D8E3|nr:alpha/beta fold hydrolase [Ferruginibacter albus]UAY50768.1 lysophospholipase [Ferruginibacter albus]
MKIKQKTAIAYLRLKLKLIAFFSKKKAAATAFQVFCTPSKNALKEVPAIFTKGEKTSFTLNGTTIRGYKWNAPHQKKILILHGYSSSSFRFHHFVQPFIDKGFEVLAFDAPGHGESDGTTINAVIYREMVKEIMNQYGTIHYFLAHSFGGLALSLALEQMPHDENTKAVFIAPATEITTAIDDYLKLLGVTNKRVKDEFNNIIFGIEGNKTEWYSMRRVMHTIKATILWIHDEDDENTPLSDALPIQQDNLPNIKFVITKGLGHRMIYRDEAIKNMVVDFLS